WRGASLDRAATREGMLQPAISTSYHIASDDTVRSNDCVLADLCSGINNVRRVNLHVTHLSRNVNINSPSETTASFTTQWHLAFANRSPRAFVSSAWMNIVSPGITGLRNFTSSALMK